MGIGKNTETNKIFGIFTPFTLIDHLIPTWHSILTMDFYGNNNMSSKKIKHAKKAWSIEFVLFSAMGSSNNLFFYS